MKIESVKSILTKAVLAGFMIGIGGIVYLSVENKVVGSFLFSFGLFSIIQFGFTLYTGKVGYIPERTPVYLREVALAIVGNLIGTGLCAALLRCTRHWDKVHAAAEKLVDAKTGDGVLSVLVLSVFCGLLMYLAVENSRISKEKNNFIAAVFGTVLPVMVFILCGFNHSVADSFYIFAGRIDAAGALYLVLAVIGNAIGGMLVPLAKKLFDKD